MHGSIYLHRMLGLCTYLVKDIWKDMVYGRVHRVHALHYCATPTWMATHAMRHASCNLVNEHTKI